MDTRVNERPALHVPAYRMRQSASLLRWLLLVLSFVVSCPAGAQGLQTAPRKSLPVVMLSDLHLDPFQDPTKVAELAASPVDRWERILSSAPSPDRDERFAAVQAACSGKEGADASFALVRSALDASRKASPDAAFVTVSGDLLVHDLDCRYRFALGLPAAKTDDQSVSASFAEKTEVFVMRQIEATFPKVPVYFALGNNDSRCNHNRFDTHDPMFQATASTLLSGLRGVKSATKASIRNTYDSAGYYALTMPGALGSLRLLVLNDTFMMPGFATCDGRTDDRQGEQEQIAWLRHELDNSRLHRQPVWVLSHLPTAIAPPEASAKSAPFCDGRAVKSYQRSTELADLLSSHADVVRLSVTGHTHSDEFHLLPSGEGGGVPIKVVGSVTPVAGVVPSFTIGKVDPASGTLTEYIVYKASIAGGGAAVWAREYAFDATYGVPDFSASSLRKLTTLLSAGTPAADRLGETLREHLLKGSATKRLPSPWSAYVCSLATANPDAYTRCSCSSQQDRAPSFTSNALPTVRLVLSSSYLWCDMAECWDYGRKAKFPAGEFSRAPYAGALPAVL